MDNLPSKKRSLPKKRTVEVKSLFINPVVASTSLEVNVLDSKYSILDSKFNMKATLSLVLIEVKVNIFLVD